MDDKPKKTEKRQDANKKQNLSTPTAETNPASLNVGFIIAIGLAAIAVALSGYLFYQQISQKNQLSELTIQNDHNRKQISVSQKNLENKLAEFKTSIAEQGSRLQHVIASNQMGHEQEWRLLEIKHLLKLANVRLNLAHDKKTALFLLETVDNMLKEEASPKLLPLRKAISDDLLHLKSEPELDSEGLIIALQQLQQNVDNLPLLPNIKSKFIRETPDNTSTQTHFAKTLAMLDGYIRIRKHDKPIEPLKSAQETQIILGNIKLMYQAAELAVMANNATIYKNKLNEIQSWLNQHFDTHASVTQAHLNQLKTLQETTHFSSNVDLTLAIDTLNDMMNHQNSHENSSEEQTSSSSAPIADDSTLITETDLSQKLAFNIRG